MIVCQGSSKAHLCTNTIEHGYQSSFHGKAMICRLQILWASNTVYMYIDSYVNDSLIVGAIV